MCLAGWSVAPTEALDLPTSPLLGYYVDSDIYFPNPRSGKIGGNYGFAPCFSLELPLPADFVQKWFRHLTSP